MLEGPAKCSIRIDVSREHQFVELRMFKPKQVESRSWFKIFNLSFTRGAAIAAPAGRPMDQPSNLRSFTS
jgi:hypothetical protein